ncbi:MAG: integron integrase, partial [Verrucomicrobia bacterium]|nr:integron integrase [Verrucomicrobiota bacterium]
MLEKLFRPAMERAGVPGSESGAYLMWLRFYLDFCAKYEQPPRDRDSLQPFLLKLAEKGQSPAQ